MKLYFVVSNFCNNKGRFFQIYGISYGIWRCGRVTVWQFKFCETVRFRCGYFSNILCRSGIREVANGTDEFFIMDIIDGGTVIAEAIRFMGAIHIALCDFLSFRNGPVFQLVIESVFNVMVDHHLIPLGVLLRKVRNRQNGIGFVYDFPVEPIVEFGGIEIQLHKLHITVVQNSPFDCLVAFHVGIFYIRMLTRILVRYIVKNRFPDDGIELVIDVTDSQGELPFGIGQKAILFDKLGNTPLYFGPCQRNRCICASSCYVQRLFRFCTIFFGKPFSGTAFPAMFLHITDYGQLAVVVSVP